MDKSRHSGTAPEVLSVDSALEPYIDYSGPQAIFDKSQKEVALGEARLEMALGEDKEVYGIEVLEHEESTQESDKTIQRRRTSGDELYDRFREFARKHIGWILLIVSVMIITIIVQAASSKGQEKLLNIQKTKGDGTAYLTRNATGLDVLE
ncbi:MAG: hypothetical protein Q9187_008431 [Circinaria calcarea]